MPGRSRGLVAALLVSPLLIAACRDEGTAGDAPGATVDETVADIADHVIVPGYEHLAETTLLLVDAVDELCGTPSTATLDAAREAWRQADLAWRASRAGGI